MRYFEASNKPGTCLWCGRKLKRPVHVEYERVPGQWTKPPKTCSSPYRMRHYVCGGSFTLEREGSDEAPPRYECNECGIYHICEPKRRVVSRTFTSEEAGIADLFCTRSCGEQFGIRAAELGFRLQKKE